jgi:hypothetical protein
MVRMRYAEIYAGTQYHMFGIRLPFGLANEKAKQIEYAWMTRCADPFLAKQNYNK